MNLAISTFFDYQLTVEQQVPLVAKAGFTHLTLGAREEHSGYSSPKGRRRLGQLLGDNGLRIDTIHGPPAFGPSARERLERAIEASAELSCPVVVFHASRFEIDPNEVDSHMRNLAGLCEKIGSVARELGVMLALENVAPGPATDLVRNVLPTLDSDVFGFCYDSAHEQVDGPRPFELLPTLGDRLVTTHLSDRLGEFRDHVPPGEGFIEWNTLVPLLRRALPSGTPLLLEISKEHARARSAEQLLSDSFEAGKRLMTALTASGGDPIHVQRHN